MSQQQLRMIGGALLAVGGYYAYANNWTTIKRPFHKVSTVSGYIDYDATQRKLKMANDGPILEYFISGRGDSGKLWCPDCEKASSIVQQAVKNSLPQGSQFLEVTVGDLSYWKNADNEFRTKAEVKCIPLMRWSGSPDTFLNDAECQDSSKVLSMVSRQD